MRSRGMTPLVRTRPPTHGRGHASNPAHVLLGHGAPGGAEADERSIGMCTSPHLGALVSVSRRHPPVGVDPRIYLAPEVPILRRRLNSGLVLTGLDHPPDQPLA